MKTFLLLALFLSFDLLAFDPCSYPSTVEFNEELKSQGIAAIKTSRNPKRFRFVEKQMIHLTVSLQDWLNGISRVEALDLFVEGSSDGEIAYFELNGKEVALVHYWPGDNEYGAFFEMNNSAFRLMAEIRDSEIVCL